jgi:hypothetical protein
MITEKRPTVWVLKEQMRSAEHAARTMDYTPAMKFGDLRFVTEFDPPLHPHSTVYANWERAVSDFCHEFDETRDFIICTGQPTAIFMIGFHLANWGKKPQFLVWRRQDGQYVPAQGGLSPKAVEAALSHHLQVPVEVV